MKLKTILFLKLILIIVSVVLFIVAISIFKLFGILRSTKRNEKSLLTMHGPCKLEIEKLESKLQKLYRKKTSFFTKREIEATEKKLDKLRNLDGGRPLSY